MSIIPVPGQTTFERCQKWLHGIVERDREKCEKLTQDQHALIETTLKAFQEESIVSIPKKSGIQYLLPYLLGAKRVLFITVVPHRAEEAFNPKSADDETGFLRESGLVAMSVDGSIWRPYTTRAKQSLFGELVLAKTAVDELSNFDLIITERGIDSRFVDNYQVNRVLNLTK